MWARKMMAWRPCSSFSGSGVLRLTPAAFSPHTTALWGTVAAPPAAPTSTRLRSVARSSLDVGTRLRRHRHRRRAGRRRHGWIGRDRVRERVRPRLRRYHTVHWGLPRRSPRGLAVPPRRYPAGQATASSDRVTRPSPPRPTVEADTARSQSNAESERAGKESLRWHVNTRRSAL